MSVILARTCSPIVPMSIQLLADFLDSGKRTVERAGNPLRYQAKTANKSCDSAVECVGEAKQSGCALLKFPEPVLVSKARLRNFSMSDT